MNENFEHLPNNDIFFFNTITPIKRSAKKNSGIYKIESRIEKSSSGSDADFVETKGYQSRPKFCTDMSKTAQENIRDLLTFHNTPHYTDSAVMFAKRRARQNCKVKRKLLMEDSKRSTNRTQHNTFSDEDSIVTQDIAHTTNRLTIERNVDCNTNLNGRNKDCLKEQRNMFVSITAKTLEPKSKSSDKTKISHKDTVRLNSREHSRVHALNVKPSDHNIQGNLSKCSVHDCPPQALGGDSRAEPLRVKSCDLSLDKIVSNQEKLEMHVLQQHPCEALIRGNHSSRVGQNNTCTSSIENKLVENSFQKQVRTSKLREYQLLNFQEENSPENTLQENHYKSSVCEDHGSLESQKTPAQGNSSKSWILENFCDSLVQEMYDSQALRESCDHPVEPIPVKGKSLCELLMIENDGLAQQPYTGVPRDNLYVNAMNEYLCGDRVQKRFSEQSQESSNGSLNVNKSFDCLSHETECYISEQDKECHRLEEETNSCTSTEEIQPDYQVLGRSVHKIVMEFLFSDLDNENYSDTSVDNKNSDMIVPAPLEDLGQPTASTGCLEEHLDNKSEDGYNRESSVSRASSDYSEIICKKRKVAESESGGGIHIRISNSRHVLRHKLKRCVRIVDDSAGSSVSDRSGPVVRRSRRSDGSTLAMQRRIRLRRKRATACGVWSESDSLQGLQRRKSCTPDHRVSTLQNKVTQVGDIYKCETADPGSKVETINCVDKTLNVHHTDVKQLRVKVQQLQDELASSVSERLLAEERAAEAERHVQLRQLLFYIVTNRADNLHNDNDMMKIQREQLSKRIRQQDKDMSLIRTENHDLKDKNHSLQSAIDKQSVSRHRPRASSPVHSSSVHTYVMSGCESVDSPVVQHKYKLRHTSDSVSYV